MSEARSHGIGARALRGMFWAYGSYVGGRFLILIATAILARLLTPDDFGLVALALAFTGLLDTVSNLGLGQALMVQDDDQISEHADTAFWASIGLSLLVSLAILAASPLVADFFGEPEIAGLVAVLGANFFLRSFGITHYSLAQRELNFRARTIAEFADAIVRGLAGIGLAIAGFGAWSLVLGYLLGTLALVIAIWICVPWRPRLRARMTSLRQMLKFGGTLTAVDIAAALSMTVDTVFVGRVLGPASAGLYSLALRIPQLTVLNMSVVASSVLFPAFSAQRREQLGQAFLISIRYVWLLALPLAVFMFVLAEPLILVAFGEQWRPAIEPMRILAVFALAITVGFPAGDAYKATSRVGVVLAMTGSRLLLLLAGLFIFVDHGISAVAACQAVSAIVVETVGIGLAMRLLSVSLAAIRSQIWPAIAGTLAIAPALVAIEALIDRPVVQLIVAGLVAPALFLLTLQLVAPEALRYVRTRLSASTDPQPPEQIVVDPQTDIVV